MAFRRTIVATSTRGLFGFKHQGQFSLVYNHSDSYPEHGLGGRLAYEVNEMVRMKKIPENLKKFKKLKVIGAHDDKKIVPSAKDIKKLKDYTNLHVSKCSTSDWYCLTHKCQGSLKKVLDSGYMLLHSRTPTENESGAEYNYVLNFDDNTFDYYENNEFKQSFPFDKLPTWEYDAEGHVRQEIEMEKYLGVLRSMAKK